MYTFPFIPFRYSKTLTIGVLILVLCLIPSSEFSKIKMPVTFTDVIVHFVMFFVFAAALYLDITKKRADLNRLPVMVAAFAISAGFGIFTEMLQYLIIPLNRSGSMGDFGSDLAGSAVGILLIAFIKRKSSAVS